MKKIVCTLFALILIVLSGCVGAEVRLVAYRPPSCGTWHGYIYVNELMGIQFELPETWFIYTNEEIVRWFYIPRDFLSQSVVGSLSGHDDIGIDAIDMRARDFFNNNNLTIYSQALSTISNEPISELEYLHLSATHMHNEMGDIFQNIEIKETPRQIGGINWYYMIHDIQGGFVSARFVSVRDGFLCTVSIAILEGDIQDIDEIWERFTEIDPKFQDVEGLIPVMKDIPSFVYHGAWNEHVYTNPSLNLKLSVPTYYSITTNRGLAGAWGLSATLYGDGLISNYLWVEAIQTGNIIPVMHTFNPGETSVTLFVRRKPLGMREFSLEKQLLMYLENDEAVWRDRGADAKVYATPRTVEISGHQWLTGRVVMPSPGFEFMADTFITMVDNHIWLLQTESNNEYELQKILSMFSQIPE